MSDIKQPLSFSFKELATVAAVRSVAGIGLGLMIADYINPKKRRRVGMALFLGSIAVGLPVGLDILRKLRG
ncbi:MAG TPA: hypothetical protein VMM84_05850 [Pyrinomonadaceae bacterium]|nr:hypothetical protein [Pyrinomonadaceae bacterium]